MTRTELSFQAYGSERTDPSFIHRLHRPDVPVDVSDSRKQVRTIFSTEPAVLVNDQVLAPRAVQHFQLRFRLPAPLPPSFRGSSVRFLYLIQVKSVYEVHRGGLEAVVYETTASTSLMVWPSTGLALAAAPGGGGGGMPDRRSSSLDTSNSSTAAALSAAAAAVAAAAGGTGGAARESLSRTNTAGGGAGAGQGPMDSQRRLSSAGGVPPSPSAAQTPTHSSAAPLASPSGGGPGAAGGATGGGGAGSGQGAADDSDVGMIDYVLGRNNCRIRWQEVLPAQGSGPRGDASGRGRTDGGGGGGGPGGAAGGGFGPGGGQGGVVNTAGSVGRSVIPFGVNRPFAPPFLTAASNAGAGLAPFAADSDLDDEDEGGAGRRLGAVNGSTAGPLQGAAGAAGQAGGGGSSSGGATGVQRQMSAGAAGLGPYARQPSRRGSLFGKVYALNVGEQPLLRLLMQPGATFGGVLDFRPPASLQPQASASLGAAGSSQPGGGASFSGAAAAAAAVARPPVACHDVVVLLESEEVVSAECRPQGKRDGSGIPGGTPYVIRRLHAEAHELTADTALTSFTFSLPATATPSFRTPMVALRWVLRFELTVGPRINFAALDKRLKSPRPAFEQLVWSLPLVVRPPVAGWGR
ncbi:hypothetical protein HXX76_011133 [Chlamydomonas incerta]|uniref:Rgp1-domain-containing protein n=1 Tax=Chlamydomonas incerta TaxID=51695 RepID=A0A835SLP5_CHLIN|nr:hypothetical protein HXX76_011133 [Chlamydomonas incerta]|eukprot:KAG2429368.1 hypothetical protein HXX76_011133 [Chlamydomonas incerta]